MSDKVRMYHDGHSSWYLVSSRSPVHMIYFVDVGVTPPTY